MSATWPSEWNSRGGGERLSHCLVNDTLERAVPVGPKNGFIEREFDACRKEYNANSLKVFSQAPVKGKV